MDERAERRLRPLLVVVGALVAVAAVVAIVLALRDDGDPGTVATIDDTSATVETTTTTEAETTTTTAAETTTTAAPVETTTTVVEAAEPVDEALVVWPWVSSEVRYDDPLAAAEGFAEELVGFTDPIVGPFLEGDARSGEVEIRPSERGPVTTVQVRRLGPDDSWWVLGSVTENVEVDEPMAQQGLSSPATLTGRALAFEGTVQVSVLADGRDAPLGEGFVTGSGGGDLGPFEGSIEFEQPDAGSGVVLFFTVGGEDSRLWEVTAVPVTFAPAG